MEIKKGYNCDKMTVRINPCSSEDRLAEFWVMFGKKINTDETLSYITAYELMDLKDEIDTALKEMYRLK